LTMSDNCRCLESLQLDPALSEVNCLGASDPALPTSLRNLLPQIDQTSLPIRTILGGSVADGLAVPTVAQNGPVADHLSSISPKYIPGGERQDKAAQETFSFGSTGITSHSSTDFHTLLPSERGPEKDSWNLRTGPAH
jgi:hypothetical protein